MTVPFDMVTAATERSGVTAELEWSEVGGAGPPMVLVHGFTGSSEDFVRVVPPLFGLRRVLLVDQLGHGMSPRAERYDYDVLTSALVTFLESSVGEPVDLLGHSLGGRVAIPIAANRPDLVRSLILMDTWADQPDRGDRASTHEDIWALPPEEALAALGDMEASQPDPEAELIATAWGRGWLDRHLASNAARVHQQAITDLGPAVFVAGSNAMDVARRIASPTTVLVGERDAPFLGSSQRLVDAITNARLVTIAGAYHSPQLSHPDAWASAVIAHLQWVDG